MDKKQPTVILLLAFGNQELCYEVIFCLLTLHYQLKGNYDTIKCVIYTDDDNLFKKHLKDIPYYIEILSKEDLINYKGKINFVHRVKTCVMRDCFKKYKSDIFYLDGDTFFLRSPLSLINNISKEVSIMYNDEYDMNEAGDYETIYWIHQRRGIRNKTFSLKGQMFTIPFTTRMWNAGVTGLSFSNAHLLDDVIELTDQIFTNEPVFTAEQFALSYILQNNTTVIDSEEYIYHYWPNKGRERFDNQLRGFFKNYKNGTSIDVLAESAFKLAQKHEEFELPKPSFSDRMKKKIRNIAWAVVKG